MRWITALLVLGLGISACSTDDDPDIIDDGGTTVDGGGTVGYSCRNGACKCTVGTNKDAGCCEDVATCDAGPKCLTLCVQ